jgi:hypothetical protein
MDAEIERAFQYGLYLSDLVSNVVFCLWGDGLPHSAPSQNVPSFSSFK